MAAWKNYDSHQLDILELKSTITEIKNKESARAVHDFLK